MSFKEIDPLIDFDTAEDVYLGEFVIVKANRFITEKDVKECRDDQTCMTVNNLLRNGYSTQLVINKADILLNRYDKPTMLIEIRMDNCESIEEAQGIRNRITSALKDVIDIINDYGYKEE